MLLKPVNCTTVPTYLQFYNKHIEMPWERLQGRTEPALAAMPALYNDPKGLGDLRHHRDEDCLRK